MFKCYTWWQSYYHCIGSKFWAWLLLETESKWTGGGQTYVVVKIASHRRSRMIDKIIGSQYICMQSWVCKFSSCLHIMFYYHHTQSATITLPQVWSIYKIIKARLYHTHVAHVQKKNRSLTAMISCAHLILNNAISKAFTSYAEDSLPPLMSNVYLVAPCIDTCYTWLSVATQLYARSLVGLSIHVWLTGFSHWVIVWTTFS